MTTTQLLLLLLLVIVVVIAVVWLMRRGAGQKAAARVEAEEMRSRAAEVGVALGGQQAFAAQAEERAAVARAEAEQRAAEAARLEEEAGAHRAAAAETQRDYEAQMRRADDLDPDVTESTFAPVPDDEPTAGSTQSASGATDDEAAASSDDDDTLPSRAERRAARDQAEPEGSWATPAAPVPAVAGAAVVGASSWDDRDDDRGSRTDGADDTAETGSDADSARVASATDYRDDVTPEGDRPADVSATAATGTAAGMSDDTREQDQTDTDLSRDVESPSGEWGGPPRGERGDLGGDAPVASSSEDAADGADDADDAHGSSDTGHRDTVDAGDASQQPTIIGDIEEFAATEPVLAEDQTAPVEREDRIESRDDTDTDGGVASSTDDDTRVNGGSHAFDPSSDRDDADVATAADEDDRDSARTDDASGSAGTGDTSQQPTMVADIEDFAATEPVLAEDQGTPVEPGATTSGSADTDEDGSRDEEHPTAETGAAVATTSDDAAPTDEPAEGSSEDRFDPTPSRDWAADEGELLDENRQRGDALEQDRADLTTDEDRGTATAPSGVSGRDSGGAGVSASPTAGTDATSEEPTRAEAAEAAATGTEDLPSGADEGPGERAARRISEFHELRDGGYGVGSAATLEDGGQPLDHPIAGFRDTMTFRSPGDEGYDDAQPDVWFYDQAAAERSGFSRSEV